MSMSLGQAYVQIIPTTKGIKGNIEKELSPGVSSAGEGLGSTLGSKMFSSFKKIMVAVGIGKVVKDSLFAGAELEQSIGGIETLFGKSANTMKKHASEAFRTVGVSANDYMQNVTSFSASLLQSVSGDTDKAAKIANMAMIDMGDNANKMGTNMQDIQNAYQGFAKQNYTMLDNLKLGYGGTKTEMERLLADAQKLTGVKYDINSLSDVYEAIHAIQGELKITGTTALEANETLSGSFNAMKASWSNLIANIAIGNGTIKQDVTNLAQTLSTFIFGNLVPMLFNIVSAVPTLVTEFIKTAIPEMINGGMQLIENIKTGVNTTFPQLLIDFQTNLQSMLNKITENLPMFLERAFQIVQNIASGIMQNIPLVIQTMANVVTSLVTFLFENLPLFLEKGVQFIFNMIDGITQTAPQIMNTMGTVLSNLISKIVNNLPNFLAKGMEIIGKLISGILNRLPQIISTMATVISNLLNKIASNMPQFLSKGFEIIGKLIVGILRNVPNLIGKIPGIIRSMVSAFGKIIPSMLNIGKNIVRGIWQGISQMTNWITNKIKGFVNGIVGGIKGFFGIKSPSRVMASQVGKFLPSGLAMGIEDNLSPVSDAMDEMGEIATRDFQSDISYGTNLLDKARAYGSSDMVSMKEEMSFNAEFDVNIAGHSLGKFTKIISKEKDKQDDLVLAY